MEFLEKLFDGLGDVANSFIDAVKETAFDNDLPAWTVSTPASDSAVYALNKAEPAVENSNTSFFDKLASGAGKLAGSVGDAYNKDPLKFLEFGAKTIGSKYLMDEKRDAATREAQSALDRQKMQAQSLLDQQNNKAALDQAEIKRYNDSFASRLPSVRNAQTPLSRINGSRVFNDNGSLTQG